MDKSKMEMLLYPVARGQLKAVAGTHPLDDEPTILFRDITDKTYYIWGIDSGTGMQYFRAVSTDDAVEYLYIRKHWYIVSMVSKYFPALKKDLELLN